MLFKICFAIGAAPILGAYYLIRKNQETVVETVNHATEKVEDLFGRKPQEEDYHAEPSPFGQDDVRQPDGRPWNQRW